MVKFREKKYSLLMDVAKGATIGSFGGSLMGGILIPKKGTAKYNPAERALVFTGAGTVIGAGLGLLYGLAKEGSKKYNQSQFREDSLMRTVVENLKKSGLKEGRDFTRDPKTANELKTKVCIAITKSNGDLKLLVNTVADQKLMDITNEMTRRVPNSSAITKKMSDRFNDVTITSVSDASADSGLVTGIAEFFIHHKYPVYLVEVG